MEVIGGLFGGAFGGVGGLLARKVKQPADTTSCRGCPY